jgi:hypothetical protein
LQDLIQQFVRLTVHFHAEWFAQTRVSRRGGVSFAEVVEQIALAVLALTRIRHGLHGEARQDLQNELRNLQGREITSLSGQRDLVVIAATTAPQLGEVMFGRDAFIHVPGHFEL